MPLQPERLADSTFEFVSDWILQKIPSSDLDKRHGTAFKTDDLRLDFQGWTTATADAPQYANMQVQVQRQTERDDLKSKNFDFY